MEKETLNDIVYKMHIMGKTFAEIAIVLEREYGIKKSRQNIRGICARMREESS